MSQQNQQQFDSLRDIHDIRQIMERSSRFISLSGLSGIAAGTCALIASWFAYDMIDAYYQRYDLRHNYSGHDFQQLKLNLLALAAIVLVVALSLAWYFTWRRARQSKTALWNLTSRKLMWNMLVPLVSGGLFILAMLNENEWRFVAPSSLLFYGLALVNGSKYTLSEIRYRGYLEIALGLVATQFIGYGLYFWALGFGILHIVYGMIMWWRYERKV